MLSEHGFRETASPKAVLDQLEKVLQSREFADAERARGFLRFTVEHAIRQPNEALKEYTIAAEVLGKDSSFDPKLDPIVRVYAGRVREKLQRYYAGEGARDEIFIELRKGSYVPVFLAGSQSESVTPITAPVATQPVLSTRTLKIAILAGLLLFGCGAAIRLSLLPDNPRANGASVQITFDNGVTAEPAVSEDGKLLAFASDRAGGSGLDIWLQQTAGGEPIRLTTHDGNDHEPSFSSDGTQIVFRSDRDGGGVYVMPTLGGERTTAARRVAALGRRPRFSPDGRWIAYWTGSTAFGPLGATHVVASSGGTSRKLATDLIGAQFPVWGPDSKHLLVLGLAKPDLQSRRAIGWHIVSLDAEPSRVLTHTPKGLPGLRSVGSSVPDLWVQEHVYFTSIVPRSVTTVAGASVWRVSVSLKSGITGVPERVTFGSGFDGQPAISGKLMVFAGSSFDRDLYNVPLDGADLKPLTSSPAQEIYPVVTEPGRLAFISNRTGTPQVWRRDAAGAEFQLTHTDAQKQWLTASFDGRTLAYTEGETIAILPMPGTARRTLCTQCGTPSSLSPDGGIVAYHMEEERISIGLMDTRSGRTLSVVSDPERDLLAARFSPDGRALVLNSRESESVGLLMMVPIVGGTPLTRTKWIPLTDRASSAHFPEWARDGGSVLFISNRDGFYCLWRQPLNQHLHPDGPVTNVRHFHRASPNLGRRPLAFAVSDTSALVSLEATRSNLWRAQGVD